MHQLEEKVILMPTRCLLYLLSGRLLKSMMVIVKAEYSSDLTEALKKLCDLLRGHTVRKRHTTVATYFTRDSYTILYDCTQRPQLLEWS